MVLLQTEKQKLKIVKISKILIFLGGGLIFFSVILFTLIFFPTLKTEISYNLKPQSTSTQPIVPIDTKFGIVIAKIGANAKVVANVNPYNSAVYQEALTQGVAHALGTVFPGQTGNIFIFSHSSVNFYEAQRYNSIFYLLDKLETNDQIELYYQDEKYIYQVTNKKVVSASDISYLKGSGNDKTLTLMTCWPAGTSLKRLIVTADIVP